MELHYDNMRDKMLASRLTGYTYKSSAVGKIGEQAVNMNTFSKATKKVVESRVVSVYKSFGLKDVLNHSILDINAVNDDKIFKRFVVIRQATSVIGLHIINEFDNKEAALAALLMLE